MFKFSVQNDKGEVLELTDSPNYNVVKITGLTPAGCTINTAAVTGMDGEELNSIRLRKTAMRCIDIFRKKRRLDCFMKMILEAYISMVM